MSQSFLESGQITNDFLRKPTETLIERHADHHERQLASLDHLQALATALPDDSPLRQVAALQPVINIMQPASRMWSQRSATSASTKTMAFRQIAQGRACCRAAADVSEPAAAYNLDADDAPARKDFILRGDDKYGDQLTGREAEFEAELAHASLPADTESEILKLVRG
ncbi:hypothetical protein ACVWYQ_003420 [Bradyrhizobium sp. USDA 3397]